MSLNDDITFEPGSWDKSGQSYLDEARDLRSAIKNHLDLLDVDRLGASRGEHPADVVLALVVPPIKEAFAEAVENLAQNLERVGGALKDTGVQYREIEEANVGRTGEITEEVG